MTTQTTAIPEVARAWVDRMRGDGERRREFTARPVTSKVPEGATIVRIQWTTTRYMRGGYTQTCPVVIWAAWYGTEWVGSSERLCDLRHAVDFHMHDAPSGPAVTEEPKRRGGWPGPRKPIWNFRPDPAAEPAVRQYMARHGLDWNRRGDRTKAINAMLATHPDARTEGPK